MSAQLRVMKSASVLLGVLFIVACGAAAPTAEESAPPAATPAAAATVPLLPEEDPPREAVNQFRTDFSRHTVPYAEIRWGGVPKDGIPAIDTPAFVPVDAADAWLEPVEPVILVQIDGEARAYPLQIMTWHEIVNDTVAGVPLLVTFCPLCNTAIAFERTVDGRVLDFGTTGLLRYSNLVMYDRQTESWWQQATGQAIAGEFAGAQLVFRPASIVAWEDFKATYPDAHVLSRDTGHARPYGNNPYAGYDNINSSPFLYAGPDTPGTLPPMARVLTLEQGEEAVAYPYELLEEERVINDTAGGQEVVVFWEPGTASALDAGAIAEGRDVGAAAAFSRALDDRVLTFTYRDGQIVDIETGSAWNVLGQAVAGELRGDQLERLAAIEHFWFSWSAFRPDTRVATADSVP